MTDIPFEIDAETVAAMQQAGNPPALLDVREDWEVELCSIEGSIYIPLDQLPARLGELPTEEPLVVLCHHGMRSAHAVAWLRRNGFDRASNLSGGIDYWARHVDPTMKVY
ncbi:rhodanese-like domain-containing protein [Indioceanicola profundi]|uniref:rhodanese-like domain-containing protein n=1 Tax=Indioceanicola profundi TaxID=2220096 RepID=UPI001CED88DC|nr:rhodanese-like domain-containing protein [Indioceanicola profundi]